MITWDELCTFLQLNFNEKADAEKRAKEISFLIPAKIQKTPHRYPCSTIVLSADNQYLALGSVSHEFSKEFLHNRFSRMEQSRFGHPMDNSK